MGNKNDVIDICYAISDVRGHYTKIAGTSICSVLMNASGPVRLHILHDGTINDANREKIMNLVKENFGQRIFFYNVKKINAHIWDYIMDLIPNLADSRLSIATFFRLIIGDVFREMSRIIYLDADTIVNLDIMELWEEPISFSGLAGAPDIVLQKNPYGTLLGECFNISEYFNAGVLLIDVDKFRKIDNLLEKSMAFLRQKHPPYLDQDVLNYLFPNSCTLTDKYNTFVNVARHEKKVEKKIYHYVSGSMGLDIEDAFDALYLQYFTQTPWFNKEFFGNLIKNISSVRNLDRWISLINKCSGKRRLVIGQERMKEPVIGLLELREGEEYISFEELGERNIDFNKKNDIWLIFLADKGFAEVKERLECFGLQENKHFINMMFLVETLDENNAHSRAFLIS